MSSTGPARLTGRSSSEHCLLNGLSATDQDGEHIYDFCVLHFEHSSRRQDLNLPVAIWDEKQGFLTLLSSYILQ